MSFEKIISFTIPHEGGAKVTDDPDDPGGLTKFGIAARYHPGVDIRNLTLTGAQVIYRKEYWDANHLDEFPEPLAMAFFDAAVNPGVGHANKILQSCLGVVADGVVGPQTRAALTRISDPIAFARAFMAWRENWYRNHAQAKYVNGLVNRCHDLRAFLGFPT